VLQFLGKFECYYINGTEKVRYVHRYFYNREQLVHFDSDVGHYVGDTPLGERWAKCWNNDPGFIESQRTSVDWLCRHNYKCYSPLSLERR
ncbi:hypothetical protein HGM15179_022043, partial [Zosterops borbonicus]